MTLVVYGFPTQVRIAVLMLLCMNAHHAVDGVTPHRTCAWGCNRSRRCSLSGPGSIRQSPRRRGRSPLRSARAAYRASRARWERVSASWARCGGVSASRATDRVAIRPPNWLPHCTDPSDARHAPRCSLAVLPADAAVPVIDLRPALSWWVKGARGKEGGRMGAEGHLKSWATSCAYADQMSVSAH